MHKTFIEIILSNSVLSSIIHIVTYYRVCNWNLHNTFCINDQLYKKVVTTLKSKNKSFNFVFYDESWLIIFRFTAVIHFRLYFLIGKTIKYKVKNFTLIIRELLVSMHKTNLLAQIGYPQGRLCGSKIYKWGLLQHIKTNNISTYCFFRINY